MPGRTVVVAGLGLIGGSLGMSLRAAGRRVLYVDPAVEERQAREAGAADARLASLGEAPEEALVVLAAPVDACLAMLDSLRADSAATSVCSVMAPLRDRARQRAVRFVAGHPFAGSHERGIAAARADLFRGQVWFLDEAAPDLGVRDLVRDAGAVERLVDPAEHDRRVALTSHLPQMLSTALAAALKGEGPGDFAGTGLQTFLRLAGSSGEVWRPVIAANREAIDEGLQAVIGIVRDIVEDRDSAAIFDAANETWRALGRK